MLEHSLILTCSLASKMGSYTMLPEMHNKEGNANFPSHFTLDQKNSNKTTQTPTNFLYRNLAKTHEMLLSVKTQVSKEIRFYISRALKGIQMVFLESFFPLVVTQFLGKIYVYVTLCQ